MNAKSKLQSFILADRKLSWIRGAFSIAASWLWAPALFISVQVSYEMGLAGLFWFTAPNVLALLLFSFLGPKIRSSFPEGVTLPQFIGIKMKSERLRKLYLFPAFFYQLMAVSVQLFAGGSFISLMTGLSLHLVMPVLLFLALSYTLVSGLKISVFTDLIQMGMILVIGAILFPMLWQASGGMEVIRAGFGGLQDVSVFDPGIAFSFGIVTSIGLIAGALSDQQYWQRSFAIESGGVAKAFVLGAFLFALVPLGLSTLGFIAVSKGFTVPEGVDTSMIGLQTVMELLPSWAGVLFFVMLLAGLSSTLDSALSAVSSLWATDVQKSESVKGARFAMIGVGLLGWLVAVIVSLVPGFGLQHLWWVFNTIAACTALPTLLCLYSRRVNEKGLFFGILIAFVLGVPLFVWANLLGDSIWIVSSALFVVLVSGVGALWPRF
jgi:Na+/proline symporter